MVPVRNLTFKQAAWLSVAMYAVIFWLTVPETIADAGVYAGEIQQHMAGAESRFWEAGHVLWRPVGYVLWTLFHPALSAWSDHNTFLEIVLLLIAANVLCGLVLTLLALSLARRLGLSMPAALAVVLGLLSVNAILNYLHSGTSYIPGLTAHFAGLWLILKAPESKKHDALYAGLGGAALALACLFWLPYVLSIPATLLAGWVLANDLKERGRLLGISVATAFVVGVVVYVAAAVMAGATSPHAVIEWLVDSGHGQQTDRRILRFPNGFTRSFLFLGDDARLIKRFVFGDPYEPVNTLGVVRSGLWKVVIGFAAGGALLLALLRNPRTRSAGWIVLAGAFPTIAFAIFVFEPGAPERYLPLYPALFFGVCALLQSRGESLVRILAGAFLVTLLLVNYRAYAWDLRTVAATASVRASWIRDHATPPGIAILVGFRDPLSGHFQRSPFAPDNRKGPLALYHVTEPGNLRMERWRSDTSCRILDAWKENGDAWVSLRLLAPRPEPAWQWTENDDPRIHWVDLPAFFVPLETGERIGDADGFAQVARSERNRTYLENACRR